MVNLLLVDSSIHIHDGCRSPGAVRDVTPVLSSYCTHCLLSLHRGEMLRHHCRKQGPVREWLLGASLAESAGQYLTHWDTLTATTRQPVMTLV
jgi:hypothetical protein